MQVDIEDYASVEALFEQVGKVDAVISLAGDGVPRAFDDEDNNAYVRAVKSKIMGQVNVARIGHHI